MVISERFYLKEILLLYCVNNTAYSRKLAIAFCTVQDLMTQALSRFIDSTLKLCIL